MSLTLQAATPAIKATTPEPPATIPPNASQHRHKNSAGKYVTVTDGKHVHADVNARLDALEAAVKALQKR